MTYRVSISLLLLLPCLQVAAAPKELDGFPVKSQGPNRTAGLLTADLDNNGSQEIVAVFGETLAVITSTGKFFDGFPVVLKGSDQGGRLSITTAATACDLNGDGRQELVVGTNNNRLYAVDLNGRVVAGFPLLLKGKLRRPAVCVSHRGQSSLVFLTDAGELIRFDKGGPPKRIAFVGAGAEAGVAVADLDGDGDLDFAVGGGDSKLHVVDDKGRALRGFPYKMSFRSSGIPAVGDIDDDGKPDIIFGSQDFKIHAVDRQGKLLPGFPVDTGYRIYSGVALADLNNDGVLDVVTGSGDSKVYAVQGNGSLLKGFPVKLDGRIIADCVIADVDKDGNFEIAVVTQGGNLHLLGHDGKRYKGFPVRLGGKPEVTPAWADLDGDGLPELVAQRPDGTLHAFRFAARGKAEAAVIAWPMMGHNPNRTGRYGPNAGRFKALSFKKQKPRTTDAIIVNYAFFDVDGDTEQGTQIRWYLNGKHQQELDNRSEIDASKTQKHQKWYYTLQSGDNFKRYGEKGQLTRLFTSESVEVYNTQPTSPTIELAPHQALTTTPLNVQIKVASTDADGDKIDYHYQWLKNGNKQDKLGNKSSTVAAEHIRKGETWSVLVTPLDGEDQGTAVSQSVVIRNTPPGKPELSISPKDIRISDRVVIEIAKPAPDDDNDPIRYTYRYWVNAAILQLPEASNFVSAGTLRKKDKVRVQVTAWDDEESGGVAEADFEVLNTAPAAPTLTLWLKSPKTTDMLTLGVIAQAQDADADAVTYRHQWRLDGAEVNFPWTVDPSKTRKGQKWELSVTPFDGEEPGSVTVVNTTILNTPPEPPLLVLDRISYPTDVEIRPEVKVVAKDVDEDKISLKYRWQRGGKPVAFPADKDHLTPQETKKGELWQVQAIPTDGESDGQSAMVAFRIVNTPPTAPGIEVSQTSNRTPAMRSQRV
ncbi:MAG: VCBS repeat-containing protein [Myxococcota bacterium]